MDLVKEIEMYETLTPGLTFELDYKVPENKTVPYIYPEAEEFQLMPRVFSTGFMIGLIEWACVKFVNEHIDWPREQSVGIDVNLNHTAATPPGLSVTVKGELVEVDGKRLVFSITAHDGVDQITSGTHQRFIVNAEKFIAKAQEKASGSAS